MKQRPLRNGKLGKPSAKIRKDSLKSWLQKQKSPIWVRSVPTISSTNNQEKVGLLSQFRLQTKVWLRSSKIIIALRESNAPSSSNLTLKTPKSTLLTVFRGWTSMIKTALRLWQTGGILQFCKTFKNHHYCKIICT